MRYIVALLLCVAICFGATSLPIVFESTVGGLTYIANLASDLLLPETINPSNIEMTLDIANRINAHIGFNFVDTNHLSSYMISSNLYLNLTDGLPYVVVHLLGAWSDVPLIGGIFTRKYIIPALSRSTSLVYGMITSYSAIQVYPLALNLPRLVQLQETNVNTKSWIGDNWDV